MDRNKLKYHCLVFFMSFVVTYFSGLFYYFCVLSIYLIISVRGHVLRTIHISLIYLVNFADFNNDDNNNWYNADIVHTLFSHLSKSEQFRSFQLLTPANLFIGPQQK